MLECSLQPADAPTDALAGEPPDGDAVAEAMAKNAQGDKAYYTGDLLGAARHFDDALTLLTGSPPSPRATRAKAIILRNRSVLALILGDRSAFERGIKECRTITARVEGPEREALLTVLRVAMSMGHRTEGRFGKARDALRLDGSEPGSTVRDLRLAIEEANICRNLGQFRAAITLLERGFELLELAQSESRTPRDEELEGCTVLLHHYMGVTRLEEMLFCGTRDVGAFTAARVHLHAARDMATHFLGDAFQMYVSRTEKALGWYHLLRGEVARAQEFAEAVLEAPGTREDRRTQCLALTLKAAVVAATSPSDGLALFEEPHQAAITYGYWKGKLLACFAASACARQADDKTQFERWMRRLAALGNAETRLVVERALYTAASPADRRALAATERNLFIAQASAWRDAVREAGLDAEGAARHPIFLHILANGPRAVPWILSEWLEHPEDPWAMALPALTSTAPPGTLDVGGQRDWWLTWGKTQGTIRS